MRFLPLLLALLLWSCTPAPTPTASPASPAQSGAPPAPAEDVLIVAKPGDPKGLDPADVTDAESSQVTVNIFDTLVRFKADSADVEPALATEWKVSEDGKQWTFKLREGVKFHDGTPFDAAAVVANFERQFVPKHPLKYAGASFSYWGDMWGRPSKITKIEAVSPSEVRFTLSQPVAPFLSNMAMPFFAIASPTALKKAGPDAFRQPVGTGPFRFKEWVPNDRVVLEANPDYWDGAPKIKTLTFKPVAENTARQLQLEKGAVHAITNVQLENVEDLKQNPAVKVIAQPGANLGYLAFNVTQEPLDDPKVRQALCHAVNRAEIVEALYHGLAQVADSPIPPAIWGRKELPYEYDPEKARQLLKEAGYPNGFKIKLHYMTTPRMYFPEPKVIAEVLQAQLGEVGVEVDARPVEWSVYLEELGKGQYEMGLSGWIADNGDPDNFLYALFDAENVDRTQGGSNVSQYADPEVHRWLTEAQRLTDQGQRQKLYDQAQQKIHDDAACLPLVYAYQVAATHPALEGFGLHPTGTLRFHQAHWKR